MKKRFIINILLCSFILFFVSCEKQNAVLELNVSPDTLYIMDEDSIKDLYLSTKPSGETDYIVSSKPKWLSVESTAGVINGKISLVRLRPLKDKLDEGVYAGKISIITDVAGSKTVQVFMSVNGHPKIATNLSELKFPENVNEQTLIIENKGTGILNWSINDSTKWLRFSTLTGYLYKGQKAMVVVYCDRTSLDNSTYTSSFSITSNSEVEIQPLTVTMDVPKSAGLKLSKENLLFDYFSESTEVYLKNTGNINYNWSVDAHSLFAATPSSGTLIKGDSVRVKISLNRTNLQTGTINSGIIINTSENLKDTIKAQINHFQNTKWLLEKSLIDVEFSKETNKIISISTNPNCVSIIDPDTRTIETITINAEPKCLSVNKNGDHVAVGHNGLVTLINLNTKSIEKEVSVGCDALDIILTTNNWAYVFPVRDQWTSIHCLNLTTSVETVQAGYSIYAGTVGRLHPSEKWIYGADNGLSPSDIEKYNIENGTAVNMYDSPYHGDYPMSGNLWFSEDGDRIFTKGKTVLKTSSDKAQDMVYNGSLSCVDNIKTLVHSKTNDKIYLVTQVGYYLADIVAASEVLTYNYTYLNYLQKYTLESFMVPTGQNGGKLYNAEGQFVFANKAGTKLYVVVKATNASGLLNGWAVQNFDIQ